MLFNTFRGMYKMWMLQKPLQKTYSTCIVNNIKRGKEYKGQSVPIMFIYLKYQNNILFWYKQSKTIWSVYFVYLFGPASHCGEAGAYFSNQWVRGGVQPRPRFSSSMHEFTSSVNEEWPIQLIMLMFLESAWKREYRGNVSQEQYFLHVKYLN